MKNFVITRAKNEDKLFIVDLKTFDEMLQSDPYDFEVVTFFNAKKRTRIELTQNGSLINKTNTSNNDNIIS